MSRVASPPMVPDIRRAVAAGAIFVASVEVAVRIGNPRPPMQIIHSAKYPVPSFLRVACSRGQKAGVPTGPWLNRGD